MPSPYFLYCALRTITSFLDQLPPATTYLEDFEALLALKESEPGAGELESGALVAQLQRDLDAMRSQRDGWKTTALELKRHVDAAARVAAQSIVED